MGMVNLYLNTDDMIIFSSQVFDTREEALANITCEDEYLDTIEYESENS